jgi:hypothetical protein
VESQLDQWERDAIALTGRTSEIEDSIKGNSSRVFDISEMDAMRAATQLSELFSKLIVIHKSASIKLDELTRTQ